jgi:WD40 repeat protein
MASVRVGDRSLLAVAGFGMPITLWDHGTGAVESTFGTEDDRVTSLHPFDLGSRSLVAAATEEGLVQVWDPVTGAVVERMEGHTGPVHALSHVTVTDRPVLASGGADGTVRLWELSDGRPETAAGSDPGPVRAICQVPGTAMVAWSGGDGTVRLVDADTGRTHQLYPHARPPVTALCSLATGDRVRIVSADRSGTVRLWDAESSTTATPMDHRKLHGTVLSTVTASGRTLLAVASEVVIRLWDPLTASVVREIHTATAATSFTALCPVPGDAAALAASDDQGVVRLLATATGRQHWVGKGHDGSVTALCLVDGVLASAAVDRTIVLWDVVTGRMLHQLSGHTLPVTGLSAVRWKGQSVLVSTSEDRTARLWDPRTGAPLTSIPLHRHLLCCAARDETLLIGLDTGLLALDLG